MEHWQVVLLSLGGGATSLTVIILIIRAVLEGYKTTMEGEIKTVSDEIQRQGGIVGFIQCRQFREEQGRSMKALHDVVEHNREISSEGLLLIHQEINKSFVLQAERTEALKDKLVEQIRANGQQISHLAGQVQTLIREVRNGNGKKDDGK